MNSLVDLHHHGDAELAPGLLDLAVNVHPGPMPHWLASAVLSACDRLDRYPDTQPATAAVASRHARCIDEVLLTAGAAEAFTLLAQGLPRGRAAIVHPQFTEPEVALRVAGWDVQRILLAPGERLRPEQVPDDCSVVVVGNPTNPTGTLHPAATLRKLRRPGRVVVVDEAFMDSVPGEPESLATAGTETAAAAAASAAAGTETGALTAAAASAAAGTETGALTAAAASAAAASAAAAAAPAASELTGTVIVRSLTKTWGLAGLRVGYLLGDPVLIAACARVQPRWSVSVPALAAATACMSEPARLVSAARARAVTEAREELRARLSRRGFEVVADSVGPFLLTRHLTQQHTPDPSSDLTHQRAGPDLHVRLRRAGIAVRRADTFPGLGSGWLRISVRDHATTQRLVEALDGIVRCGCDRATTQRLVEALDGIVRCGCDRATTQRLGEPLDEIAVGRVADATDDPTGAPTVSDLGRMSG